MVRKLFLIWSTRQTRDEFVSVHYAYHESIFVSRPLVTLSNRIHLPRLTLPNNHSFRTQQLAPLDTLRNM